ncbi:MAG: Fic family protein [Bacteroidota bacterium]
MYNWQLPDWPHFKYDGSKIDNSIDFERRAGRLSGIVEGMSAESRDETIVEVMVSEAIKTSAIEGEFLSREDVASSIRRNLGLKPDLRQVHDEKALGASALMVDVRRTFDQPLTKSMLFSWHKSLMRGTTGINAGQWRFQHEPMQVVSGPIGKEAVHFEAPPSSMVPELMRSFVNWFNASGPGGTHEIHRPVIRSAIAHVYFESIHPFEDGNGRIGRSISEKALSQVLGHPVILSLSRTIEKDKTAYYEHLKLAQRSNELTPWIKYFQSVVMAAQEEAEELVDFTLAKVRLLDRVKEELNPRQLKAILRMLEEGPAGFGGGMTARKYMGINKTSKATATRDLQHLVIQGILSPLGGGRSTAYQIRLVPFERSQ